MRKSPIFKQPAVYNSLSYLSCSDCKEDVPISTKYLNEMKKAGAVKCPFCRSTNVIELSVVEWGERCYKRVGKNMPRRTDPRIKQIQPFKWEVASRTKIQYSYIVELHPGDV